MGTLASNRKRGDEFLSLNQQSNPSKKSRFSFAYQNSYKPVLCSNSTVSRISRYPEAKTPFKREVHAPCKGYHKFGFSARSSQARKVKADNFCEREEVAYEMSNFFTRKYDNAKLSASDAMRYVKEDKQVIDLDDEPQKEAISEDSSIEEVEMIENGREKMEEDKNVQPSSSSGVTNMDNENLREDKMMGSLSLNYEVVDLSSVEAYRKLLESAEKRTPKLQALEFEIVLEEKRLAFLGELRHLKKPVEKSVEEVPRGAILPLTDEEEAEVQRAFSDNYWRKVLVTHKNSNIDITGQILQCLRPGAWLNDEVINVYLELLKERETREPQKFLKCHFFNTFFYKKLISDGRGYNYKAVRRWTSQRKLGYRLIDCDKIFVPIHKEIHWCLAVINKKENMFQYLDSLKGKDTRALNALAKYFVEEVKDKSGKDINVSSWGWEFVEDLPEQENGYDCGMFMLKYIDFYSRGLGLCFGQEHMPYFRVRTAKEILRLRAE